MTRHLFLSVLLLSCLICPLADAQEAFTRIRGPEDRDIKLPAALAARGHKDPGALQEIISFLKVTQLFGFHDMTGTGTVFLPDGHDAPTLLPAKMLLQGADRFRLDVQTSAGERTMVIDGSNASFRRNKTTHTLPPTAAALSGLAFVKLGLMDFSSKDIELVDRGVVAVDGAQLHRLTLQFPFPRRRAETASQNQDLAIDLYFEMTSHLLVKSAVTVRLDSASNQEFLQVTTYGDYRQNGGMLIPFAYHKTSNGQPEWTVQLNGVQLNSGSNPSDFHLER